MNHDRSEVADSVLTAWRTSASPRHFFVDDLLPATLAKELPERFPSLESLKVRCSLRERKRSASDLSKVDFLIVEVLYAFQQPVAIERIGKMLSLELVGDPTFYTGSISAIQCGDSVPTLTKRAKDRVKGADE